jgi:hypothetical protein
MIRNYIGALLMDHEALKSGSNHKGGKTASGLQPRMDERAADLVRNIEALNNALRDLNTLVDAGE